MTSNISYCDEDAFGPVVSNCRGGFDFTFLFEDIVLSILPSVVFLIIALARLKHLYPKPQIVDGRRFQNVKLVAIAFYGTLQVPLIILWSLQSYILPTASVTAASLSFVNALVIGWLSRAEHFKSIRPSSILNVYFLFSVLFDAVQVRTLWLAFGNYPIPCIFTASLVFKALVLILEAVEKGPYIRIDNRIWSPEETSGVLNRGVFYWLNRLVVRGSRKILGGEDLYALHEDIATARLAPKFWLSWRKSNQRRSNHAALSAIFRALKWEILAPIPPRLALIGFTVAQPLLLRTLLDYLQEERLEIRNKGYGIMGAYGLVYLGLAVSTGFYWYLHLRALTMVRGCLVSAIYEHSTRISLSTISKSDTAVTLMSADVERIVLGSRMIHELWANFIQVIIATYFLWKELGIACVAPVMVAVLSAIGSAALSSTSSARQKTWMEGVQVRIRVTASMLSSIKGTKMTGMSNRFSELIRSLRRDEINLASGFRMILCWTSLISFIPELISPVITLAIFVARANATGQVLDVSRLFTSISLLVLLSQPLSTMYQQFPQYLSAMSCLQRIGDFLCVETRHDYRLLRSDKWVSPNTEYVPRDNAQSMELWQRTSSKRSEARKEVSFDAFVIQSGTFAWSDAGPCLREINVSIPRSKLTLLIGPVASGKSSLCKALLGEIPLLDGQVQLNENSTKIAFCDQTPHLINGTIQENIIGFSDLDRNWYDLVISASGLEDDLAVLTNGDQQRIGSNGINLSGGQKQKVAIARAVYSRASIAIFDDVFSGFDATSEEHVFKHIFGTLGLLRARGTTIVLSTHKVQYLPFADNIIALSNSGRVGQQGTFQELNDLTGYVQSLSVRNFVTDQSAPVETRTAARQIPSAKPLSVEAHRDDASRQLGEFNTYKYYFDAAGWWTTALLFVVGSSAAFFLTFSFIWLKWWTDASAENGNQNDGLYLGVYGVFQCLALFGIFCTAYQGIITLVKKAGLRLHDITLDTVLNAPMAFFSITDSGVITNRFSQDMQFIDGELPQGLLNLVLSASLVLGEVVLITVASPYIGVGIPFVLTVFYFVQRFYLKTSRQLRHMDLETKSPLYTHFLETLSGIPTIRAFGWADDNLELSKQLLDESQNPFYLLYMIQRWLTFVLDVLVAIIAVAITVLAIEIGQTSGFAGVALTQVMSLNMMLRTLILTWTEVETSIGSVSRVKAFSESTPSEHLSQEKVIPPPEWPSEGKIEFRSISASYGSTDDKPALKEVTLSFYSGEKVGVCGRSGSGKSSLITSLFRMIELHKGSIFIDDLDLSTLPRETVRSRLNALPQDPYFLHGSVRFNLDPHRLTNTDGPLIVALTKVGLWDLIQSKGGLGEEMKTDMLSHGQRQLFCLARAILRPGKIVVLDEVTSSVDVKTDALMQVIIREEFRDRTIVAIAHRLETIEDFDRIVVMHEGRVVEVGRPAELLGRDSWFRRLRDSHDVGSRAEQG